MEFFYAIQDLFYAIIISLPRVASAFAMIPFFSRKVFSGTLIRNGFTLALVMVLVPFHYPAIDALDQLGTSTILLILIKEIFIGSIIGFLISIPFWAIEAVGFIIDNQRGSTMASSLNPLSGDQTSTTGLLLNQMMAVLFFSTGAVLVFLGLLYQSYVQWPVYRLDLNFRIDDALFFLEKFDDLMMVAVVLAGPAVIAMFITEFCFALVNRFTPQLDVFILSMPVKSAVAFFILILYLGTIIVFFDEHGSAYELLFKELNHLYYE